MVKQRVLREDAGSNPSSPLHFARVAVKDVRSFVVEHHYKHGVPAAITDAFALYWNSTLAGVALFGYGAGNPRAYWGFPLILFRELVRFVLLDAVPRNAESLFLGWCLREMAKLHRELIAVLSYADPAFGHRGTIYRATNWKYLGLHKAHRGTGRGLYSAVAKHKYIYVFPGKRGS